MFYIFSQIQFCAALLRLPFSWAVKPGLCKPNDNDHASFSRHAYRIDGRRLRAILLARDCCDRAAMSADEKEFQQIIYLAMYHDFTGPRIGTESVKLAIISFIEYMLFLIDIRYIKFKVVSDDVF